MQDYLHTNNQLFNNKFTYKLNPLQNVSQSDQFLALAFYITALLCKHESIPVSRLHLSQSRPQIRSETCNIKADC